jgi:hypothetical protein
LCLLLSIPSLELPIYFLQNNQRLFVSHCRNGKSQAFEMTDTQPIDEMIIDTSHSEDTQGTPYIMMANRRVDLNMGGKMATTVLGEIARTRRSTSAFELYDHIVGFRDEADRTEYARGVLHYERVPPYMWGQHTIDSLLTSVEQNDSQGRGTAFVFHERGGLRNTMGRNSNWSYYAHLWGGILVRKDGNPERWCFNIFCTGLTYEEQQDAYTILNQYPGRSMLWAALHESGYNVTEVNYSTNNVSNTAATCVINTFHWIYKASRQSGEPWKRFDARLAPLELHRVADVPSLFERYVPASD